MQVNYSKKSSQTIRKKLGGKQSIHSRATCMASSVASIFWDEPKAFISYGEIIDIESIDPKSKKYYYEKTKPWAQLNHREALLVAAEYVAGKHSQFLPVQFSLNVSPKTETLLKSKAPEELMDEARDRVRKAFKSVIREHPICFWMIDEYTGNNQRLHFHGCLGIPRELITSELKAQEIIEALISACNNSPLCAKFEPGNNGQTVDISTTYESKRGGGQKPVDSDFVHYALKTRGRRILPDGSKQPKQRAISKDLRRLAGQAYTNVRNKLKPATKINHQPKEPTL